MSRMHICPGPTECLVFPSWNSIQPEVTRSATIGSRSRLFPDTPVSESQ